MAKTGTPAQRRMAAEILLGAKQICRDVKDDASVEERHKALGSFIYSNWECYFEGLDGVTEDDARTVFHLIWGPDAKYPEDY